MSSTKWLSQFFKKLERSNIVQKLKKK